MGLVCQRCHTNVGLYKEIMEGDYLVVRCTICNWCTGKLDRHHYEDHVDNLPTSNEAHKKAEDWK